MSFYHQIHEALKSYAQQEKAAFFPRFFKTGKGEYGEGDVFIGVTVPNQRLIAKQFYASSDEHLIIQLLDSMYHEERLVGLFLLNHKFLVARKQHAEKQWVDLYLKKIDRVNNWDLVDSSAHIILGQWLEDKDRSLLYELAAEKNLWKNRIAILSTMHFIKKGDIVDILKLSALLLTHQHDLMHKAIGWMLREAWKKEPQKVEDFISKYIREMPRTMLRYSIEKIEEKKRQMFLAMK
jgi:3-methyladenine DNA glycosylase AlkD